MNKFIDKSQRDPAVKAKRGGLRSLGVLRRQGRGGGNKFRPLNRPLRLGGHMRLTPLSHEPSLQERRG
ncbi:MAG: hypothetical protein AAFY16_07545 [Cyanobacteria bacterium J06642_3]